MMFLDEGNYRILKRCIWRWCIVFRWKFNRLCDFIFLGEFEGFVNIGDIKGIFEGGDGIFGSFIEECVDSGDFKVFFKYGYGFVDGLDGFWRSIFFWEVKKVFGKSDI